MSSRATPLGQRPGHCGPEPGRQDRPQPPDRARPGRGRVGRRIQDGVEHLGEEVGPTGVHVHAHGREDDDVGVRGQQGEDAADGGVHRDVDVVEGRPEQFLGRRIPGDVVAVQLGQIPELVAGHVGRAEGEPGEVGLAVEEGLGGRRHSRRGAQEPTAESEHLGHRVPSEHLVDRLRWPVQAREPVVDAVGLVPAPQHDAVMELPAAHELPGRRVLRRAALVGVDGEHSPAGATKLLPHGCRGVEVTHEPDPLLGGRPLERVEEPVVLEGDAAVQRVLGARREAGRRSLEVQVGALIAQAGEVRESARQPTGGPAPARWRRRNWSRVSTVNPSPLACRRRISSTTVIAATPSAAVARSERVGAGEGPHHGVELCPQRQLEGMRPSPEAVEDRGAEAPDPVVGGDAAGPVASDDPLVVDPIGVGR